MTFNKSQINL